MKINFDIECTPEEARAFMGLPDVAPMQEKMMGEVEKMMLDGIRGLDPEVALKTWLPATIQGWGEMQKLFWQQMGNMTATGSSAPSSRSKSKD